MLNKRLEVICSLVDSSSNPMDLGCDHAYLAIELSKKCNKVVASDALEGPLDAAKNNIKNANRNNIEVVLADGLDGYRDYIDTLIISGMGGLSMIGILDRHRELLPRFKKIILSPNNFQEEVRRYLVKNKFIIEEEKLVKSSKFIYQIISFIPGKGRYSDKEYYLGVKLYKEKLANEYFSRLLKENEIILRVLPKYKFIFKKIKVNKKIKYLHEILSKTA
jgi:hypothetical protein